MRDANFEKRWDIAVTIADEIIGSSVSWGAARPIILSWYKIRSEIAHGRAPSQLADIPTVLYRADEIAVTFDRVVLALNSR
jgi:hypothetical protein